MRLSRGLVSIISRACNLARGIDIRKETVLASMMLSVDVLRCNGMEEQEGLLMAVFFWVTELRQAMLVRRWCISKPRVANHATRNLRI